MNRAADPGLATAGGSPKPLDSLDLGDAGNLFLEHPLNAVLQRHARHGAAVTSALEADSDDSVRRDLDEFDVAAVGA